MEDIFRSSNEYNPTQDWRPSLAIGHREIPMPQIKELASSIVSALKARGRAFHSIEEFANSGLLQASIDETSINTIVNDSSYSNADTSEKLPRNAPAYLSQADILSALAPYISARSDTFKIHAKAITKNPATGTVLAQAGCIARVQRVPTRVDDNTSATMENAKGFGRRFIITDFQWTTSTEQ